MTKRVGLIGHCGADSSYLRIAIGKADPSAEIVNLYDDSELQDALRDGIDLLLVNRVLDSFASEHGVEYIRKYKKLHPNVAMMMISNYPEVQTEAEQAGAAPGFGKRDVLSSKAIERLKAALNGVKAPI